MLFALCFFLTITPWARTVPLVYAAIVAAGVYAQVQAPSQSGGFLLVILFLQAFTAGSGFSEHADRGHYDQLLTSGCPTGAIAVAHWVVSALPGVAAWVGVGLCEAVMLGAEERYAFRPAAVVGLLLVSSGAWLMSLWTARYVGGVAWTLVLVLCSSTQAGAGFLATTTQVAVPATYTELLQQMLVHLLVPFVLLSRWEPWNGTLALDALVAIAWLAAGGWYIARREWPLRAAG